MDKKIAIVLPAKNEESVIESSVRTLDDYLQKKQYSNYTIMVADNNSTDKTANIVKRLLNERILYNLVETPGKGAAVIQSWLDKRLDNYDVYAFMDADMATDLEAFPRLIQGVEGYGLVMGSRYIEGSEVHRRFKRRAISRGYRTLFHLLFTKDIADPQCGFKALSPYVRNSILPHVKSTGFFFDTEIIMRVKKEGIKMLEVPVSWYEGSGTTLQFYKDVPKFLKRMAALYLDLMD